MTTWETETLARRLASERLHQLSAEQVTLLRERADAGLPADPSRAAFADELFDAAEAMGSWGHEITAGQLAAAYVRAVAQQLEPVIERHSWVDAIRDAAGELERHDGPVPPTMLDTMGRPVAWSDEAFILTEEQAQEIMRSFSRATDAAEHERAMNRAVFSGSSWHSTGWPDDGLTEETRRRLAEALEADTPAPATLPPHLQPAGRVAGVFGVPIAFMTGDHANRAAKRTPWLRLFKGGQA